MLVSFTRLWNPVASWVAVPHQLDGYKLSQVRPGRSLTNELLLCWVLSCWGSCRIFFHAAVTKDCGLVFRVKFKWGKTNNEVSPIGIFRTLSDRVYQVCLEFFVNSLLSTETMNEYLHSITPGHMLSLNIKPGSYRANACVAPSIWALEILLHCSYFRRIRSGFY